MSILDILNKDTWAQGAFAYNRDGLPVNSTASDACKFCVSGAINRTYVREEAAWAARFKLRSVLDTSICVWNDTEGRTWEEIEAAIKKVGI